MDPKNLVVGAKLWVCKKSSMRAQQAVVESIYNGPGGPDDFKVVYFKWFGGRRAGVGGVAVESEEIFDDELVAHRVALANAKAMIRRGQLAAEEAEGRIAELISVG
jgi:hypothetical protein